MFPAPSLFTISTFDVINELTEVFDGLFSGAKISSKLKKIVTPDTATIASIMTPVFVASFFIVFEIEKQGF